MAAKKNTLVQFQDMGTVDYGQAWQYQENLCQGIADTKLQNWQNPEQEPRQTPNYLLFCRHPHVYTLGRGGAEKHLLLDEQGLKQEGVSFYRTNRGGDITYHGPGQIVGYPILDLDNFFTDIHRFMRTLEEVIIRTLAEYDLNAGRIRGATGVWIDAENAHKARKICAMGIRCTRWVTMHGWALNVNTNMDYFKHIVPCGIADKGTTSLHKELQTAYISEEEVKTKLLFHFAHLFEAHILDK